MRVLLVLPLLLAGCDSREAEPLNGQAVAAPAPDARTAGVLQPGQWALTTRITSIDGANVSYCNQPLMPHVVRITPSGAKS